jgi:hypothetical protein
MHDRQDPTWNGPTLRFGKRVMATVVPDRDWPRMYRVQMPDGRLTDMVNLTRAKDAAYSVALGQLNGGETRAEAPLIRFSGEAA